MLCHRFGALGAVFFLISGLARPSGAETICDDNRKVVGGVAAAIDDTPWQVMLLVPWPNGKAVQCGGSLIQDQWVLTAAHCFPSTTPLESAQVKGGVTNSDLGTWIDSEKVIVHEGYNAKSHENDIALIHVNQTVGRDIIPVAQGNEELKPCQLLEVTGWGAIKEDGGASTVLQKADIPLVDNATCNATDAYNGKIKSGMLCAGYRAGGIDSCQGDSGGPLVLRGKDGPVLVGVVSWGEGCARKLKYGVYTRVGTYSDWIASTILNGQR